MYYCLKCKTVHQSDENAEVIYKSGFVSVDNQNLNAGICKDQKEDEKESD